MVDERASVGMLEPSRDGDGDGDGAGGVVLEGGVGVECGATVEGRVVGEGSVVEVGARVGRGAVVGKVSFFLFFFLRIMGEREWGSSPAPLTNLLPALQNRAPLRHSALRYPARSHHCLRGRRGRRAAA